MFLDFDQFESTENSCAGGDPSVCCRCQVLDLVNSQLLPAPIVSHVVPFERTIEGFELLLRREVVGKVVVEIKTQTAKL